MQEKYFGDANPIGKTIQAEMAPEIPRKITLVFRDLPENTHLKYHVLFRFDGPQAGQNQRFNLFNIGLFTYLVMPENYNVNNFKAVSASFFNRFMADIGKQLGQTWNCWLQPLPDIHFIRMSPEIFLAAISIMFTVLPLSRPLSCCSPASITSILQSPAPQSAQKKSG